MARIDVDEAAVYQSIVDRLIRGQLGLNQTNCYETAEPVNPGIPPGGEYFVTVSPGESQFDGELFEGGGTLQLTQIASVVVTIFTRIKLDRANHDHELLHDAGRGLYPLTKKLLAAMAAADLTTGLAGDTYLRWLAKPVSASGIKVGSSVANNPAKLAWRHITFSIAWDWDLT